MGHLQKRPNKTGGHYWQARYRAPDGTERSKNFGRKLDAERFLTHIEHSKLRGEWVDPHNAKQLFGPWAERVFAARVDGRPSTRALDDAMLRNHVLPEFGDRPLGSIHQVEVKEWVAELRETLSASTVRKAYGVLTRVFDEAVDAGYLFRSPCRNVRLPVSEKVEKRFLSLAEVRSLLDTIDSRYRLFVLTAVFTGLRFGELAGLTRKRLDLAGKSLRVEEILVEVQGRLILGVPKTRMSIRKISLPGFLVEELAGHVARTTTESFVFTSPEGKSLRRASWRQRFWLPAVAASVREPCRFHDLRHTHAALMIAKGVHPKVLQERLGHASAKTTLDVYGHLFDGADAAAVETLGSAWEDETEDG